MNLTISKISKTYGSDIFALKDVSLFIEPGLFGLLGPNGAGKSTLMRIIGTLQEADSGAITLGPIDVIREKKKVREILGYLPQEFGVYPKSNAEELLSHFAYLKGVMDRRERKGEVDRILALTNLEKHRRKKLGSFSGGMKQRFGVAQALLGDPKILIVDEPTTGLDPEERIRFLNILSDIGEERVVILSTHIVNDVSDLCSEMAIIHEGTVLFKGQPRSAMKSLQGKVWRKSVEKSDFDRVVSQLSHLKTQLCEGKPQVYVFCESSPGEGFEQVSVTLEDVYFSVIGGHWEGVVS